MILLDSDHVSVLADLRDRHHSHLVERLTSVSEPVAIPVIAIEEHLRGWLAQIRRLQNPTALVEPYGRLVRLLSFFAEWEVSLWTNDAAGLFSRLRAQKIRIGTQDLRIAAISLSQGALLLSANRQDFEKVPGLLVENWLGP